MLINNLGSLKAELARYMFHQRFQPDYDTAVQNFEAVANRRLRVRQMEAAAFSLTSVGGAVALPPDYLLWRSVLWSPAAAPPGKEVELSYAHPAYMYSTATIGGWTAGTPKIFTIVGNELWPNPDDERANAFHLHYYRKIPTINGDDNNSNWLLTEHPDLYLEGALFELFALGRNGEAAVAHKQLRDEKLAELIQLSALTTGATSSKVRSETAEYF
jgi:hypothetical protein